MDVKHGLYINVGMQAKGCLKTGSWGEYLGSRRFRMGSGQCSTIRNFLVCTVPLILSGWLNLEDWDGQVM